MPRVFRVDGQSVTLYRHQTRAVAKATARSFAVTGAGHVQTTLRDSAHRGVTLDGQRFDPQDPDARLYATFFCRNCGREHHPVVLIDDGGLTRVLPRPIDAGLRLLPYSGSGDG